MVYIMTSMHVFFYFSDLLVKILTLCSEPSFPPSLLFMAILNCHLVLVLSFTVFLGYILSGPQDVQKFFMSFSMPYTSLDAAVTSTTSLSTFCE